MNLLLLLTRIATGSRCRRCLSAIAMGCFFAIGPAAAQTLEDSIAAHFRLLSQLPAEKVYLHIDKPYYAAGDRLWFKAYLLNAVTHRDDSQSNFVITELINRSDSVVLRKKIRRDSLGFHNAFLLPPTLPAGDYYLRAYTNWMLNSPADYFYSRNIVVGNAIDNTILSTIEYQRNDQGQHTARLRFTDNKQVPFENTVIRYRLLDDNRQCGKGRKRTDSNGEITLDLPEPASTRQRLEVTFDDPQYIYQRTFYLPTTSDDFHLTFFPEGGALLRLPHQVVAFKAQRADGHSVAVEAHLLNETGDTLGTFRSEHDGMGRFTVNPIASPHCHVVATSADGITRSFPLPEIQSQGIALSMVHHRQEIRYELQKTDDTDWPERLYLVAHTRGRLALLQPIDPRRPVGRMSDSLFSAGITHFLLVGPQGNTLSERLIFVADRHPARWTLTPDSPSHGPRQKVTLRISATDSEGAPLDGTFSVAVTHRRSIQPDTLADNIQSYLLLTSDLKGYVEHPGAYFLRQDTRTQRTLDLLMLTHGWRRHRLDSLRRFPTPAFPHAIERGQTISGRIKGFFGKGVRQGPIFLLAPSVNLFEMTTTNERGEFVINTSFRDSTALLVQARTRKGSAAVDIELDTLCLPAATPRAPFGSAPIVAMQDYLTTARDQYYTEGGMRVYNLREVVVTGTQKKPSQRSIYAGGINTYTVEGEQLERYGSISVLDAIMRLPSVTVTNGNEVHIRNHPDPALILIDDIAYEDDPYLLTSLQASDLASISLLRGPETTILGTRGNAGAIVLTLKDGRELPVRPPRGIVTCMPLGYSGDVEFYHPVYDTPERKNDPRPDLRSTLYWNPALPLDEKGQATLEYYTTDTPAAQDIIIEGVDKNGNVHRYWHVLRN